MWLHLILPLGLQSENIYSLVLSRSSLISDEKCEGERSGGEGRGEAHYDSFWGRRGTGTKNVARETAVGFVAPIQV